MRRRLVTLATAANPSTFMTLTASVAAHRTPEAAFAHLRAAWPRFVHRLRRQYPSSKIDYLWVWETTAAGFPHLHVLLRAPYIPQRWLSRTWQQLAGSPVVDIRAVGTAEIAARYMAKYLTKRLDAPAGYRRWGASPGFLPERFRPPKPDNASAFRWEMQDVPLNVLAAVWYSRYKRVAFWPDSLLVGVNTDRVPENVGIEVHSYLAGRAPPLGLDPLADVTQLLPMW